MTLSISAPNLSHIATLDGTRYGELPFALDAHLSGSPSQMEFTRLNAKLGESQIRGLFKLDLQKENPVFDLKLR